MTEGDRRLTPGAGFDAAADPAAAERVPGDPLRTPLRELLNGPHECRAAKRCNRQSADWTYGSDLPSNAA